jgi:pyridoxamine 5'-phosphate oxidase
MTKDISNCKSWLEAWNIYYGPEKEMEPEDPNAICVSSVDDSGMPNGRFVLLKEVTEIGFLFYTNLDSQKGLELFTNKKGALTWWSRKQGKSVRVQGEVEQVSDIIADQYWKSRSVDAQVSASISRQSQPLASREQMEQEWDDFKKSYEGKDIPRPANWTGIYIKPLKIEFWQHHGEYTTRLHVRIVFSKNGDDWSIERLYP